MKVELLYAPGCEKCAEEKEMLRATAEELIPNLRWRELNVLDVMDYAVDIGVLTLPAIAIDGKVAFSSLPSNRKFRRELIKRISKRA